MSHDVQDAARGFEATRIGSERPVAGPRGWTSVCLGLGLFALYTANGRSIGAGDVVPATLIPLAIVRGDGPFLDRFDPFLRTPEGRLPGHSTESRGRDVSRYPIGPALLAAPFYLPQVLVLDRLRPGWESDPARFQTDCDRMGKNAASAMTAIAAVALLHVLRGFGLARVAWPTVLVVALGSGYWPVASQALWQHGPAALCLTLAIWLLQADPPSRRRLAMAGLASSAMVVCRPIDLVFSAMIALWVFTHFRRPERLAFFLPAIAVALALATYNVWFFDTLTGGYAEIEQMHPWAHGVKGSWTTPLAVGVAGTLFSPSHGLFVYSPWVPLAITTLAVPTVARRVGRSSLAAWLLLGLVPNLVLLSKYSCWWGGHCFGPRFWIDAMPLFALALAFGLDWAWSHQRGWIVAFGGAIVVSAGIQLIGVLCYPTSWYGTPTNADRDHKRLWDWHDSELTRGLAEGIRPRMW